MKKMKEYEITFNILARDHEHAKKLGNSICEYFLANEMCTIDSVRPKYADTDTIVEERKEKAKLANKWLETFGYKLS